MHMGQTEHGQQRNVVQRTDNDIEKVSRQIECKNININAASLEHVATCEAYVLLSGKCRSAELDMKACERRPMPSSTLPDSSPRSGKKNM